MRAHQLSKPAPVETNPLELNDIPVPEPGPGQVRLRVSVCGVCHTDLHTVEGEVRPPSLPVTPGHQVVGRVEAVHPDLAADWKPGDRAGVPWFFSSCGNCAFCRRGEENLCEQAKFTGFHVNGGYAEVIVADARALMPLPASIPDEQAAPLLCAGIVGYRSLKLADIRPGEHIGLFGFGASAHLCIQVLHHWGCKVSVFTRSEGHQEHARELGADWVGRAEQSPGEELDRAVIFAPAGPLAVRALELVRPGGTVALNAIHMSDIPSFRYQIIYGERTLRSVANATPRDGIEFLQLAGEIGIRSTVTQYPFEHANAALADMKHSRINGEAVLVIRS